MKKLKDFSKFFKDRVNEEADNPLDSEYLSDVERRAREEHDERIERGEIRGGGLQNTIPDLMSMVDELQRIQNENDNIPRLEALAKEIMEENYGSILNLEPPIELDYRLVRQGDDDLQDMADRMEDRPDEDDDDDNDNDDLDYGSGFEMEEEDEEDEEERPDFESEVGKRKLVNILIQGAAKKTHRIIHTDTAKDGLNAIDPRLFPLIDKLIKTNEYVEWMLNAEQAIGAMRGMPNGAAEVITDEEDQEEREEQEQEQEQEQDREGEEGEPIVVKALAIDFVVLLHELSKGIYEALLSRWLPEDKEFADRITAQTDTREDEFYDLRNGAYIKQDIDDFVTANPKVGQVENGLEYFYGLFVEVSAEEFIEIFKGIIAKTDEARRRVDEIIDEALDEEIAWQKGEDLHKAGISDEPDTYGSGFDINQEDDTETDVDYSKMSQRELEAEMDKALEVGDFAGAAEIRTHYKKI